MPTERKRTTYGFVWEKETSTNSKDATYSFYDSYYTLENDELIDPAEAEPFVTVTTQPDRPLRVEILSSMQVNAHDTNSRDKTFEMLVEMFELTQNSFGEEQKENCTFNIFRRDTNPTLHTLLNAAATNVFAKKRLA